MSLENDYKAVLEDIANSTGATAKQLKDKAKAALNPVIEYEEVDVITWTVVDQEGSVIATYRKREDAVITANTSPLFDIVKSMSTKVRPKKKQ